jgi:phage gpG-like protein
VSQTITLELSPGAIALMEQLTGMPFQMRRAIARGMDRAGMLAVSDIQARRLTGQGPFPVEEHRLGVKTSRLRTSLRWSPAQTDESGAVVGAIGSNVIYAAIHEFGDVINRTTKPGNVLLRTTKKGALLRQDGHPNLARFGSKRHKLVKQVSYQGGKQYTITIPARAPIGHGVADNMPVFEREISVELEKVLRGGPPE